jgi:hypothetical protein
VSGPLREVRGQIIERIVHAIDEGLRTRPDE